MNKNEDSSVTQENIEDSLHEPEWIVILRKLLEQIRLKEQEK